jgi:hypothetical protein
VFHILSLSSDGEEFIPYAVINKVLSFWQDVLMAFYNKLDHLSFMKTIFLSSPAELANKSQTEKKTGYIFHEIVNIPCKCLTDFANICTKPRTINIELANHWHRI